MLDTRDLIGKLAAKLDILAAENLSLAGMGILDDCRRLCGQLAADAALASNDTEVVVDPARKLVLVVDDDADSLRVLKFLLERRGFRIACLENPLDVMDALEGMKPDLILMDLMMPQMTGFELLPKLKRHPVYKDIKVIVTSSRTFDRDRVAALNAGASDFIDKPFHLDELVLRVQRLVSN